MIELVRSQPAAEQVSLQFEVVPAYDLLISLAAVAHPDRYELPVSWARQVRKALPADVRSEVTYFFGDPMSLGTGTIQLVPDVDGATDPSAFIASLQSVDSTELVTALLSHRTGGRALTTALRRKARGKNLSETDEGRIREYVGGLKAQTRKRFWEILHDPAASRDRYLALLRAYHESWFAAHYPEVQPFLVQRAKQGRRSIGKLATGEVIARVTGGFTLQSPGVRSVTLVPSYYAAPFVIVVKDGPDVVLVYGARPRETESSRSPIDSQTIKVLKALADETRLRILQLLAERPLYGQQLAEALGVSHPTVSHHMAQLRIAGLTRTELAEDGSQTYSVRPEALAQLCAELRAAFIDGSRSDGGSLE
jgi:ArsR family transcriptional regulator